MSADARRPDPAPEAEKLPTGISFFILFGGPVAWFVQTCVAVPMLSWPCYPHADRLASPLLGFAWTRPAAILLSLLCIAISVAAGITARTKLREIGREEEGSDAHLVKVGHGRTRFTALWGLILSFSFAILSALTLIPFLMVSRCAG